jgi:hypothetical protein
LPFELSVTHSTTGTTSAAFTTTNNFIAVTLCTAQSAAAQQGNIKLMAYVLEEEPVKVQRLLKELLYLAGTNKLEAAQWLHAQGAPWPDALSAPIIGR